MTKNEAVFPSQEGYQYCRCNDGEYVWKVTSEHDKDNGLEDRWFEIFCKPWTDQKINPSTNK